MITPRIVSIVGVKTPRKVPSCAESADFFGFADLSNGRAEDIRISPRIGSGKEYRNLAKIKGRPNGPPF
jgi:hypothetical protein